MTETTAGALPQVTALDEERRRYEGWMAQLEARRGTVPDHVLQRVRSDYEARLREVVAQLGQHAELLRSTVAERAQELSELRDAERQRQDERAEAELRAAVGEYSPEQWREIARRTDAELSELAARRADAEAELERLEQVLSLAVQGGTAPDRSSAAAGGEARGVEVRDRAVVQPPAAASALGSGPAASRAADDWDDLPEPSPARPSGGAAPGMERGARDLPPWDAPGETAGPPVTAAAASAGPAPQPPGAPRGAPADGDTPQAKTLRCHECGTLNYPTEWYCERCGGELAAL